MASLGKRMAAGAVDGAATLLAGLRLLGPRRRGGELVLPREPGRPRVLLLALDHLGDALMATPLPALLRETYPEGRITLLCRPHLAPLWRLVPAVDRVWTARAPWWGPHPLTRSLRPGHLLELVDLVARLRGERFDAALDLRGDLRHLLLAGLARPEVVLGHTRTGGRALVSRPLTLTGTEHEVDRKAALVAALGAEVWRGDGEGSRPAGRPHFRCRLAPKLVAPPAEVETGRAEVAGPGTRRLLLDPGGKPVQRLPAAVWGRVARELARDNGGPVLLSVAPGDEMLAVAVEREAGAEAVRLLGPAPSLPALAGRVAACDLVLSADTGIAHLAAALGRPTVTVYGPSLVERFGVGAVSLRGGPCCREGVLHEVCDHRPPGAPGACLEGVTAAAVVAAAREAVDRCG